MQKEVTKCPKCGGQDLEFVCRGIYTIKSLRERRPMSFYCCKCSEVIRWYPRTGKITARRK